MRPKIYFLLERAIEEGIVRGYNRAHKHVDDPTQEQMVDNILDAVMGEIVEVFDFEHPWDATLPSAKTHEFQ